MRSVVSTSWCVFTAWRGTGRPSVLRTHRGNKSIVHQSGGQTAQAASRLLFGHSVGASRSTIDNLQRAGDTLQISFKRPPSSYAGKSGFWEKHGGSTRPHDLPYIQSTGRERNANWENGENSKMQKRRIAEMQEMHTNAARTRTLSRNLSIPLSNVLGKCCWKHSRRALPLVRCFLLLSKP